MRINRRLKAELEEILKRKETILTLEELAQEFEKVGRSAPCAYFSALPGVHPCKLGHELDCLNCSKYEPHEPPGTLESAICEFSESEVSHIMEFAESDGFYRCGETLCGRLVDERAQDVDIYDDESFSQRRPCKKCNAKSEKPST